MTATPEAPADVQAATAEPAHARLAQPAPHRATLLILGIIGFIIVGIAALIVVVYFLSFLGPGLTFVGGILALVPLTIVLLGIRWIDRWEPEPLGILLFAFFWGAGVSIVLALTVDTAAQFEIGVHGGPTGATDLLQSVVQAPIVEESAKGFGVLLIFWVARKYFDGPVDGIVYATSIAAGFAFSENILYFGRTLAEHGVGPDFAVIFVARGLFSPFAHALFTSCTGYALGRAAERSSRLGAVGWYVVGVIPAAVLHALWNGGLAAARNTIGYYFTVEVPIFLLAVGLVLAVRSRERRITRLRLGEYAEAGWFTPDEVALLSTWTGRRHALRWADLQPDRRRKRRAMVRFVRDSTRLGHARQRLLKARAGVGRTPDEQELLARISADRAVLVS